MNRVSPFRKAVVRFLATNQLPLLEDWGEREWARQFYWLDRSGLALPLAVRLLKTGEAARGIPILVLESLDKRLRDNQLRMSAMLAVQDTIQSLLAARNVRVCCLKGFSLISDCYSGILERHQVDIDLLVDPSGANRAADALKPLGYKPARVGKSGETRLVRPWMKHLTANSWLYDASEGPAVELHTRLWEPETDLVDFSVCEGWMNGIYARDIQGIKIPCLAPEWQCLHLLLHLFRHLIDSWIRLASVYEIAIILRREKGNDRLWHAVVRLAEQDPRLASSCALVLSIVSVEFLVPLPIPLDRLCRKYLSGESALWVEHFREEWLYANPPGTKLALLVQRQFCRDRSTWRTYSLRRLFPFRTPHSLSVEAAKTTRLTARYAIDECSYQLSRVGYHLLSDWNYIVSLARWKRLTYSSGTVPIWYR